MIYLLGAMITMVTMSVQVEDFTQELLSSKVQIFIDGQVYEPDSNFHEQLADMLQGSYTAPAFGVCMDDQVKEERQQGVWLEFDVAGEHEHNDLPYTRLLINIQPDFYGYNVLRYYDGKYDGRCIYLNLSHNSTSFYEYIVDNYK